MKSLLKLFLSVAFAFTATSAFCQDALEIDTSKVNMAELPVVSPYFLQHQYLSVITQYVPADLGDVFSSPETLNTFSAIGNGFRSPFKDEDIEVSTFDDEGKKIYVWRFPEPEFLREALYMMFVPVDGQYQAYAISIGQTVDWEISTSTESARRTYGRIKKPESAKECLELLKKRGAYTGNITPGEFLQNDYIGPEYRQ